MQPPPISSGTTVATGDGNSERTVTYRLRAADHWQLQRYLLLHIRSMQRTSAIGVAVIMSLYGFTYFRSGASILGFILSLPIIAIFYAGLAVISTWLRIRGAVSGTNTHAGERYSITIGAWGLRAGCEHQEITRTWNQLGDVHRTASYLYIFVTPLSSYIIPLVSFPDAEAADAYERDAREWSRAARATGATTLPWRTGDGA